MTIRQLLVPLFAVMATALSLFSIPSSHADVIEQAKGSLEGRILENSAQLIVFETIKGEYLVLKRDQIISIQDEPVEMFFYRRGQLFEERGQDNRALLDYMEALNRNPDFTRAEERREAILQRHRQQRWQEGIQKAQEQIQQNNYREAINTYKEVLQMQPNERTAQRVIQQMSDTQARIAYQFFNHCWDEQAIVELTRAEELNPNSAEIYYVLARIHHSSDNFQQARLEYERALEINPNHGQARSHLERLNQELRENPFITMRGS